MNGRISLDTNIVIRLFKNDPEITRTIAAVSTLCLPVPVIAEILFTARNSSRPKENLKIIYGLHQSGENTIYLFLQEMHILII